MTPTCASEGHRYVKNQLNQDECAYCGLLKTTVEAIENKLKQDRRDDLLKQCPSEQIRVIWSEMKELKRLFENGCGDANEELRREELFNKFERIDILFGRESTLDKAIIYYLDHQNENN